MDDHILLYLRVKPEEIRVAAIDFEAVDGKHGGRDLVHVVGVHAIAHFACSTHRDRHVVVAVVVVFKNRKPLDIRSLATTLVKKIPCRLQHPWKKTVF